MGNKFNDNVIESVGANSLLYDSMRDSFVLSNRRKRLG